VTDSPALPKPVQQPGPPVIVGGTGRRRTPALAARYAAEANVAFVPLSTFVEAVKRFEEACQTIGRDPATLICSAALTVCCGADEAEYRRRAAAIGRSPVELRESGAAAGTPAEVAARIASFRDAGAARVYLQVLDLDDLDHLRLIAAEVAPQL
jgi:alkanesulfonate monooxygenase SsuD/methylene tetrahydromethanopterin reductase-like flavin-dependent oxidoreductase (luciferase family)